MVEAKNVATYIVEPTNADINASNGFTVRKRFKNTEETTTYTTNVSTMFDDILDQMTRPTGSSSTMKGGLLFLKNGTYTLDSAGIIASDTTDITDVHLRMIGESREKTIIKSTLTGSTDMLVTHCSVDLENITFNGNSSGTKVNIINTDVGSASPNKILKVKNCKFTNATGFNIFNSTYQLGLDISECIFDNSINTWDQAAIESTDYCHVHDNYFDRTGGETDGEGLTSGSLHNANIHHNTFLRADDGGNSISLEGFDAHNDYDMVSVNSNVVQGQIRLGGSGTWSEYFAKIYITSNIVTKGSIGINGPDTSPIDKIMDVVISNNFINNAYDSGIYIQDGGGYTVIRNNIIKGSNSGLSSTTFDKGLIYIDNSKDVIVTGNELYMPTGATYYTPYGIRYSDTDGLHIKDNRIINKTANEAYIDVGGNTNTSISRSL